MITRFFWTRLVLLSLLLTGLAGCSTYRIMRYDTGARPGQDSVAAGYRRIPGVPFYAKRAVCRQETVYQQELVRLSFRVHEIFYNAESGLQDSTALRYTNERVVTRATLALSSVTSLRLQPSSEPDWRNQASTFERLPEADLTRWEDSGDRLLVSNRTAPHLYVDYENPYYLNADRPLVGSSSVNATLANDGTLTTAAAEGTDSTLGTLLSAIPTTALLSEAFNVGGGGEQSATAPRFKSTLEATTVPVLHTLSTWYSAPMPCWDNLAPITPRVDNTGYTYSRTIGSGTTPPAVANTNAFTVSGQISLPQAKP
jgi:hypothetical protein